VSSHVINGAKLGWRAAGEGEPVIFLHAFPFNSGMWDGQLADVPPGWQFIAPDMRGFGDSAAPGSGPLTMDTFANDVVGLMDHLNIDQAVICGLSMGGYVALPLVARYPDRVRAVAFAATRANADNEQARKSRIELAARARQEGVQPVIDAFLPKLVSAHNRLKTPGIDDKLRWMMEMTSPESMARALEGMAQRKDYTTELANINAATLVIRGELDEIIPANDMEFMARTVRGARHEVVSLAGHMLNIEAPDVFNRIFASFLKMLPPPLKLGDFSLSF
jgi:3-oxoadipate enol-lactonase